MDVLEDQTEQEEKNKKKGRGKSQVTICPHAVPTLVDVRNGIWNMEYGEIARLNNPNLFAACG